MIEQLLNYQEVDTKLKTIEDEIRSSEEYKKLNQANRFLKTVEETRSMYEERSAALISSFEESNRQISLFLSEKDELQKNIEDEIDEKEVAYLVRKTKELQVQLNLLESEIQKLSSEISDLLSQYNIFCKKYVVAREQRVEYKEKYEKIVSEREIERTAIEKELAVIEKKIPQEYIEIYKERRKDGKFQIFCKVENGYCSACRTELFLADKERLKKEKIIECANCHKLIYENN